MHAIAACRGSIQAQSWPRPQCTPEERETYARVLVPLDGSARGEAIVPQIEELATRLGSEVLLLRVWENERRVGVLQSYCNRRNSRRYWAAGAIRSMR